MFSEILFCCQARSIQELAKKNFENLRQDSDDNEPETKIVRRGRPPTKNFKKPLGRPSLERARSELSDATLASGTEHAAWTNLDLRKSTLHLDKSGIAESSGRFYCSRNDVNAGLLSENKFDRDEGTGLNVILSLPFSLQLWFSISVTNVTFLKEAENFIFPYSLNVKGLFYEAW